MRTKFGTASSSPGTGTSSTTPAIGGARHSQHIYEEGFESVAADMRFAKGTPAQWAAEAKTATGEDRRQGRRRPLRPLRLRPRRQPRYKADWSG